LRLTLADGRQHFAACFEFALGTEPDPARAADAARMGAALSNLHVAMSQLQAFPLPVVSALRAVSADDAPAAGAHQMLHGDFNASNLRQTGDVVRIFDLDDCGYGPPAFDVANALYMVLFDTVTHGTVETYETFRRSFVDGYVGASDQRLPEEVLDRFIDLRVRALGSWLDDVDNSPIGIRTASRAWRATLRSFVTDYRPAAL
jgi:Ser/Thr protein kinase RdoA (MazF antagonist)